MTRQQTKKNYSLRKLKTGTASVAVALTVLGAGFANQTEVRAEGVNTTTSLTEKAKYDALRDENTGLRGDRTKLVKKLEEEQEKSKNLEKEKQKLENQALNFQDVIETQEKENEDLKTTLAKTTKENEISEASRKGLSNDLEASRAAKKELEAKHQKLEADYQVSETSRKGLSRDLEASREANKKVTSELTQAKAQLSALEESKKLSEKEKAELQAKLDAQGKALKEQLAKQTEELAKLRAEKAAGSKIPATKPANKERSGRAAQTATRPSQNKGMRSQLPSTGEAVNPFFTAAAATVMVSAGMLALKRKEEN
ncbi:TPA: YSIRK-type signal peptide-containing protein [Streptococcus pyogenes]|nr:YSIRK-type signal peptide-containing protein [Streptococcus pyogenes]